MSNTNPVPPVRGKGAAKPTPRPRELTARELALWRERIMRVTAGKRSWYWGTL